MGPNVEICVFCAHSGPRPPAVPPAAAAVVNPKAHLATLLQTAVTRPTPPLKTIAAAVVIVKTAPALAPYPPLAQTLTHLAAAALTRALPKNGKRRSKGLTC